jgi:hypothetical protein
MKLWLDDLRDTPFGYTGARSVDEAKELITDCEGRGEGIEVIDLDYDLGRFQSQGGNGLALLEWLAERESFYPVEIHSTHPYGVIEMQRFLDWNWPF